MIAETPSLSKEERIEALHAEASLLSHRAVDLERQIVALQRSYRDVTAKQDAVFRALEALREGAA